jgi:outer membrane receptor protein involved in Fe transport
MKPKRWTLGATTTWWELVDSDFSSLGMTSNKGYCIVDLLANYRLMNEISVFAAVHNAANEQYMEVLGYPAVRRNFRIGLRAGF